MRNIVLLIVDVQSALIEKDLYNRRKMINNIKNLLSLCRENNIEVIYVRHDDGVGSELEKDTAGWEIYNEVAPEKNEKIFEKEYNSAFKDTGLKEYMDSKDIRNIILVGLQTEYCIDATCKSAFEQGYNVFIPEESTSTCDNKYFTGKELCNFYTYGIWKDRFAKVLNINDLEEMIKKISWEKMEIE